MENINQINNELEYKNELGKYKKYNPTLMIFFLVIVWQIMEYNNHEIYSNIALNTLVAYSILTSLHEDIIASKFFLSALLLMFGIAMYLTLYADYQRGIMWGMILGISIGMKLSGRKKFE